MPGRNQHRRATIRRSRSRSQVVVIHRCLSLRRSFRRSDKQRSSRSRGGVTVLHARRPPHVVRMSRVLSIPEARIKSSNPFVWKHIERDSNTVPDACRSFYTTPGVRRIQARVEHLLLRRSSMSVLAQDVLPLQHIVHHSSSSGF